MYVKKQFLDNKCSKCRKRNHIFTTTSVNIFKNKKNFLAILLQILHELLSRQTTRKYTNQIQITKYIYTHELIKLHCCF